MTNAIPDITIPLQTAVDGVVTQGLAAVGVVFPAIFTIVGAIAVWRIGVSIFRRIAV